MAAYQFKVNTLSIEAIDRDFKRRIEEGMEMMAEEAEWAFRRHAASKLHSSKDAYLSALHVSTVGSTIVIDFSASDKRNNSIANAVEFGSEPFDLKPGFLTGNKTSRNIPIKPQGNFIGYRRVSAFSGKDTWIHKRPGTWKPSTTPQPPIRETVMDELDKTVTKEIFDRVFGSVKI